MIPDCHSCGGTGSITDHLGVVTAPCWTCGGSGTGKPYRPTPKTSAPWPLHSTSLDPGPPTDLLRHEVIPLGAMWAGSR